jgi:hypothetical protein
MKVMGIDASGGLRENLGFNDTLFLTWSQC